MIQLFKINLFAALLLLVSSNSFAQNANARVSGKIVDIKGEPLIGAIIQVLNTSTGFKAGNATNADGEYDLRELPLGGPYTVTASYVGFQEKKSDRSESRFG